ncbi:hypothetical protein HO173_009823 [Letharia columbiana]|uniref:Uncharacterized protein n=1 Tax=Letharia columbiana TaxID=112416 RepID=A0A8H6FNW5_9LECA|nr:uncharacterized protein HO173_009823 [Letharia columbiana]KAF6231986.1 hypothetical protein HO173_009823 [Letharia columbiana]
MPVVVFDKPAVSDEPAELTAKQIAAYTNFGYRLPSAQNTTKADSKTVIPPVPATAQPISKIIERDSRSALQSLRPSNPPAQQLETRDFGLNNADSMPAGGLESSIPHVPITQESIATFLKPGAALDEVEKRRKSSRQGNSRTFTREPNPSAALSQGLRKRTVSFDEAEESSKRRRVGPPSPSQPVRGPAIAASTGVPESKTEEPDVATEGNPSASALVDAGAPNPFLCIIQADNSSLIGSFAKDTEEWAFSLGLDAGRRRIPTMNMRFFSNGIEGPEYSQTGWCLGDYIEGDWMVTNFKVHRVADCPDNGEICHPNVLAACNTDEEKARLICISLEAWPKILGHFNPKDRPEIRKPDVKKLFGAVFTGRHPYELRIWFRAPYNLERFEKQCLSFFTRYFEQRRPPHEDLYDADDVCFEDHLKAQEEASST